MSKRTSNWTKVSVLPAKTFKREKSVIASIDGKRTATVWVELLENDVFIACVIVNVEAGETVTLSRILDALREQYCEVLQSANNFNIYSGLNNEVPLSCNKKWTRKSHGGGWSDEALRVTFSRTHVQSHLITDEKLLNLRREMRELLNSLNGAESILEKPQSLRVSNVPLEDFKRILDDLNIRIKAAKWNNLPSDAHLVRSEGFEWLPGPENSPANRDAYMKYLEAFPWPEGFGIVDVSSQRLFSYCTIADYLFKGSIDVVLASAANIREQTLRHNILLAIELKKASATDEEERKAIIQHLCSSRQNWMTGVLTLLTDLNDSWCFFWFGRRGRIFRRRTNASHAKFLLKNMFNSEVAGDCPEGFSSRLSWNGCFPSKPGGRVFGY